jgi:long-chain acyl-CoA synthetase
VPVLSPAPTNGVASHGVATPVSHAPPLDPGALFRGARLLVLGGTGFLGKVFLAMLLDRFPDVGHVYLLVRSSKTQTSAERFTKLVHENECLKPLRDRHGANLDAWLAERVTPIDGDVSRPNCGIADDVLAKLRGTLHAVVNVAGVVDFHPPLDEGLEANAFGAQNLVALAKAIGPHAEAKSRYGARADAGCPLMHTSTCYVAGYRKGPILEEEPFAHPFPRAEGGEPDGPAAAKGTLDPSLWNPEREIADCLDIIAQAKHRLNDAFRQSDFRDRAEKNLRARGEPITGPAFEDELAKVRRKWLSDRLVEAGRERAEHWGWPNTYTYTKSIGEQIIAQSGLPYTLARPACCETTNEFPFPGWNEGISTSVPFIFLALKGQTHLPGGDTLLDFIPSDMVAAGMLLTVAELLEGTHKPVYQYGANDLNPCTSGRFGELIGLYKRKSFQKKGGNPLFNFFQAHVEPAVMHIEEIDRIGAPAWSRALGTAAKLLKGVPGPLAPVTRPAAKALEGAAATQKRIGELLHLFAPFSNHQHGPFDCSNTRAAYARLAPEWKAKLDWTPDQLDWTKWMMDVHMVGVEKWIVPEMDKKFKREKKPLRAHETLVSLVYEMANRWEHALALSHLEDDGFTRITFLDVRDRMEATAARLAAMGVKKGDRVVLAAKNHPDWAIGYFGILRAGGVAVPVDAELEGHAFANVAREADARLALLDPHVTQKSGETLRAEHGPMTQVELHWITEPARDGEIVTPPALDLAEDDLASLIFTSGTTGKPKGVKLTHKNFASMIASLAPIFPLTDRDRVLSVLPLHHTFEFSCGLLLPFSRGARVQYPGEINGERLARALELGRTTAMVGVPALFQLIERRVRSQIEARGPLAKAFFDVATEANRRVGKTLGVEAGKLLFGPIHQALGGHLRLLISGGAALPKETQELFAGLGLHLGEGYGLTEAAPVLTVSTPSPRAKAGQVGKAIPGVELKIHEPDESGVGEVVAKGPNVMAGYTDEEATSAVFTADGWLRTGDLGKLDKAGRLSIVGRIKDVILTTTGENVYPDDVERALGEVPGISELAIVGLEHPDPSRGERIACLASPESRAAEGGARRAVSGGVGGRAPDDEDLPRDSLIPASIDGAEGESERAFERAERNERALRSLRAAIQKLPYGQQPSIVHLYDAKLPRTATRKVKRNEVQAILRRLVAATSAAHDATAGEAGPVRVAIAAVSGRGLNEIVADATLQGELGFDSLMLTELLEALESRGKVIDPAALQACRSVADVENLFGSARARGTKVEGRSERAKIEGRNDEREIPELPEPMKEAAKRLIGKVQDAFYGQVMAPKVFGSAFIPHNRPTIVVANHTSHLDMGFVRHALGTYGEDIVSLAAQDYFFENGWKRAWFENFTNLKAIDRKGGVRQSLRQAAEVIGQGKTVLIFPEGTRTTGGDIQDFKPLVGHLALTHGVDILPIWLGGTYEAMKKGAMVPTKRDIVARIGMPLEVRDLRRLTAGKSQSEASREVARIAREAVIALREGKLLDLSKLGAAEEAKAVDKHPLVSLFEELETKFQPGSVAKPTSFYFTLGNDEHAKWTVVMDAQRCSIRPGKPEGGTADCVLKTSPDIFRRIVREAYTPGVAEFMSGAVKSNDVELLMTFQKAFALA